jgi:2-polyprenyl-3-methyl-5-hydroxy-6-metoxy-1,4-benzoquinol methylase
MSVLFVSPGRHRLAICINRPTKCSHSEGNLMFELLKEINARPEPFQYYTADTLWTDEHTSKKMLEYHLNESVDVSSRKGEFIQRSVDWIVSHFNVNSQTCIADFGCGPGLYTTRLAEKGADVTGVDFSERSIRYAKETAAQKDLGVHYIQQNYLEFETDKRFDLIIMIMCDFCALSPSQRRTMIRKFSKLLKPGGSVLLDVYSLVSFDQRKEAATYEHNLLDGFWSPESYYGFLNTFKYDQEKVVLDKYTIIEQTRTRVIYNWLQYFSRNAIATEFEANGLKIAEVYSDVAGTPFKSDTPEFAVVAKKPSIHRHN